MPTRTESFDEFLSKQLQDPDAAKDFLLSSLEGDDGFTLIEALIRTINCMGIKEFSKMSGIHRNSISRMLAQKEIPKMKTLNKYLAAFNLQAKTIVEPKKAA